MMMMMMTMMMMMMMIAMSDDDDGGGGGGFMMTMLIITSFLIRRGLLSRLPHLCGLSGAFPYSRSVLLCCSNVSGGQKATTKAKAKADVATDALGALTLVEAANRVRRRSAAADGSTPCLLHVVRAATTGKQTLPLTTTLLRGELRPALKKTLGSILGEQLRW